MEDLTGSTALELASTGSGDVVDQLNAAAQRIAWGWWAVAGTFLLGLLAMPYGLIVWVVLAPMCGWLVLNDKARKTVVIFYDLNDEHFSWFDSLVTTWGRVTGSQRVWRVLQSGTVATTYQFKVNSGASRLLNRVNAAADVSGLKQLATNIAIPSVTAGNAALYFLPDRVLMREGKRFSDAAYSQFGLQAGETRFIEDTTPPGDAVQVGQTWRYVNVKGGPDRRYKDNRVLPVMLYGTVDITSAHGLQWHLQVSRRDAAAPVVHVLSSASSLAQVAIVTKPFPKVPPDSPPVRRRPDPTQEPGSPPRRMAEPMAPSRSRESGFIRAILTRTPTPTPSAGLTFTAIDIETTGLDPEVDRIVEIGLVKFTADGTVVDEFATMVNNPGSNVDARAVHGIEDSDLLDAPSTEQVLPEAFAFVAGTVLVAHNLDFEEGFLKATARRTRMALPRVVGLCTLQASRRQLDGRAFSLTAMYKTATGGWCDQRHTALGDARAVREVLLWLLRNSPKPLFLTQPPPAVVRPAFQQCPISCRAVRLTRSSVSEVLDAFPQSPTPRTGDSAEVERYKAVLAEAVDDGRLSYEEADKLTRQARLTRLTGIQLRQLHQQAWNATHPVDKDADWASLSPARRREMYLLADALGLRELAEQINQVIQACAEPEPSAEARYLRSLRVAIVGDTNEVIDLRKYAESYGAKLAVNITKTVKWMVSTAPETTDSRHTTARRLGIPIISPAEGSARLDEAIREAKLKAVERQREIDKYTAVRRQREAEADAYWRPSWRAQELDYDPKPSPWMED